MKWDWNFVAEILPVLLDGAAITVQATLVGSLIALVVGLAFAIWQRSHRRWIRLPVVCVVQFWRGTPLLVQLFFIFFVLPEFGIALPAFVAGVVGLGLHYACYTAEVYRAGIANVDQGQWDAAQACNLGTAQAWRYVILPQAVPPMIPALGNYVIGMFKESALLSAITVAELMTRAQGIGSSTFRYTEPLTLVGIMFLVISVTAGLFVMWLERRLGRPH